MENLRLALHKQGKKKNSTKLYALCKPS